MGKELDVKKSSTISMFSKSKLNKSSLIKKDKKPEEEDPLPTERDDGSASNSAVDEEDTPMKESLVKDQDQVQDEEDDDQDQEDEEDQEEEDDDQEQEQEQEEDEDEDEGEVKSKSGGESLENDDESLENNDESLESKKPKTKKSTKSQKDKRESTESSTSSKTSKKSGSSRKRKPVVDPPEVAELKDALKLATKNITQIKAKIKIANAKTKEEKMKAKKREAKRNGNISSEDKWLMNSEDKFFKSQIRPTSLLVYQQAYLVKFRGQLIKAHCVPQKDDIIRFTWQSNHESFFTDTSLKYESSDVPDEDETYYIVKKSGGPGMCAVVTDYIVELPFLDQELDTLIRERADEWNAFMWEATLKKLSKERDLKKEIASYRSTLNKRLRNELDEYEEDMQRARKRQSSGPVSESSSSSGSEKDEQEQEQEEEEEQLE